MEPWWAICRESTSWLELVTWLVTGPSCETFFLRASFAATRSIFRQSSRCCRSSKIRRMNEWRWRWQLCSQLESLNAIAVSRGLRRGVDMFGHCMCGCDNPDGFSFSHPPALYLGFYWWVIRRGIDLKLRHELKWVGTCVRMRGYSQISTQQADSDLHLLFGVWETILAVLDFVYPWSSKGIWVHETFWYYFGRGYGIPPTSEEVVVGWWIDLWTYKTT